MTKHVLTKISVRFRIQRISTCLSPLKNYYFHSSSDFEDPEEKKVQKCFPFFLTSSQRDYKEGKFPVLITSNCAFSEFNALERKSQDYKDLKEKYFKEVLEAIEKRIAAIG